MFCRVLRCYAWYISNHTMKHNSKQLLKKRARNFKSFQKLVYVKADNLAKILTNYILFSAQETSSAAWRKMYPGIVYTEQGQRAAVFQADRKQEVYWRPFQRSWQTFSCEITRILAKMRSDGNCHMSLGYLVEINPLAGQFSDQWTQIIRVSHWTPLLLTGRPGYQWGKLTSVHIEFIYN